MSQATSNSSTRRAVLGAVVGASAVPFVASAHPASASPIAAPPGAERWMAIPAAHEAMFLDLSARLGSSGASGYPEGRSGEGMILVWVEEANWRKLMTAAIGLGPHSRRSW